MPFVVDAALLCRYGAVNLEYAWDELDSEDGSYWQDSTSGDAPMSPRTARLRQQQQAQQERTRRGPRVLKPEGAALLQQPGRGQHVASGLQPEQAGWLRRPVSPSRTLQEPYQMPAETDDLASVVRTFLQHEVLKHGRRSKLAGSALGRRRALDKPPASYWTMLGA